MYWLERLWWFTHHNNMLKIKSYYANVYSPLRRLQIKEKRFLVDSGNMPSFGAILLAEKNNAVIRYSLPEGTGRFFTSNDFTYLLIEEALKYELRLDEFFLLEADKKVNNRVIINNSITENDGSTFLCLRHSFSISTISLGVQSRIRHSRLSVIMVMFLPFFKESSVRLSIPFFRS